MKLFGWSDPDPVEIARQNVVKAQQKNDGLVTQLQDAEKELASLRAQAVADTMELGHDPGGLEIAAQAASCETLRAATDRAQGELQEATRAHGREVDQAERSASIAEIEQLQSDLRGPATQLLETVDQLVPLLKRAANLTPDACALAALVELWHIELPQAFQVLQTALQLHAHGIENGRVRARLPEPEQQKPRTAVLPVPEVGVLPLFDVTWVDSRGQQRTSAKFHDIGVSPEVAAKAISAGVALASDSAEARKERVKRGGFGVDYDRLVNLDAGVVEKLPALPERWGRISPTPKWSDARQTSGPLSGWIGGPRPTTTSEQF